MEKNYFLGVKDKQKINWMFRGIGWSYRRYFNDTQSTQGRVFRCCVGCLGFMGFLPFWDVVEGVKPGRIAGYSCFGLGQVHPKYSSADAPRCKLRFWVRIFCLLFFFSFFFFFYHHGFILDSSRSSLLSSWASTTAPSQHPRDGLKPAFSRLLKRVYFFSF